MATPSDNLESMARSLEDINLYFQAISTFLNRTSSALRTGQTALAGSIRELSAETKFQSAAIVNLSRGIMAKVGKAIFAPSVRRSNKTEEEIAADAEAKKAKAAEKENARLERKWDSMLAKEAKEADKLAKSEQDAARRAEKEQLRAISRQSKEAVKAAKLAEDQMAKDEAKANADRRSMSGALANVPRLDFKSLMAGMAGGIVTAFQAASGEVTKFTNYLSLAASAGGIQGLAAAGGAALGVLTSLPGAFMDLTKTVASFVGALDPGLMGKLALVMADLMAVVGIGLRPILVVIIQVLRTFADLLKPIMQEMQPAMTQLGEVLLKIAIPVIVLWAKALKEMIPAMENLAPSMAKGAVAFGSLMPVVEGIISIFGFWINSFAAGVSVLIGGLQALYGSFIWFTEKLGGILTFGLLGDKGTGDDAKAFEAAGQSMKDALKALRDAVNGPGPLKKGDSTATAQKAAQFTGIADLGKNLMQQAFGSSSENIAKQQLDVVKEANVLLNQLVAFARVGVEANPAMAGVR